MHNHFQMVYSLILENFTLKKKKNQATHKLVLKSFILANFYGFNFPNFGLLPSHSRTINLWNHRKRSCPQNQNQEVHQLQTQARTSSSDHIIGPPWQQAQKNSRGRGIHEAISLSSSCWEAKNVNLYMLWFPHHGHIHCSSMSYILNLMMLEHCFSTSVLLTFCVRQL